MLYKFRPSCCRRLPQTRKNNSGVVSKFIGATDGNFLLDFLAICPLPSLVAEWPIPPLPSARKRVTKLTGL
jgi:hypothetical protein